MYRNGLEFNRQQSGTQSDDRAPAVPMQSTGRTTMNTPIYKTYRFPDDAATPWRWQYLFWIAGYTLAILEIATSF